MQPDRGLARPGCALDADRLAQRRPDDVVLVGGDGGHDVAHRAAAGTLDLPADQLPATLLAVGQRLVLVAGQLTAREAEAAAAGHALRIGGAGLVERPAHRRPPVDDHRVADGVADVPAADVEGLARRPGPHGVGASEERRDPGVGGEGAQPLRAGGAETLGGPGVDAGVGDGGAGGAHLGEAVRGAQQVGALGGQHGVGGGGPRGGGLVPAGALGHGRETLRADGAVLNPHAGRADRCVNRAFPDQPQA